MNVKLLLLKTQIVLSGLAVFFSFSAFAAEKYELSLVEFSTMQTIKVLILQNDSNALVRYNELISRANEELPKQNYSVMHKLSVASSGDKHDYLSLAPYFWPDPSTDDGLPWIRKDGEVNPDTRNNTTDKNELDSFFSAIRLLGDAFYYSDNHEYSDKAISLINTWFLNDATKMNPNLNYGQGIPGINDGRPFGIIEFGGISNVITTLELLKNAKVLDVKTEVGMKEWLTTYVNWLQTSETGVLESTRENNHGTHYDLQLYGLLLYLGENEQVRQKLETVTKKRIASQIQPDGSQPHELERTKSFSYFTMNLSALTKLAWLAQRVDVDLWNFKTVDGRGIKTAYEFLIPFATVDKKWTYKQIKHVDYGNEIIKMLNLAAKMFNEQRFVEVVEQYNSGKEAMQ